MHELTVAPLPDLETHLGYWLRLVSNHVSAEFTRGLQARQISIAEWVALRYLHDRHDLTQGELARLLGMTRGAVSKVFDKLESKGWVTHQTKPDDHRVQVLSLTPEGKHLLPQLMEIADGNDRMHFDCLSAEEQATFKNLLKKLADVHHWHDVPVE